MMSSMPLRVLMLLCIGATGCSLRLAEDTGTGQCGTAAALRDDFEGEALSPLWDYSVPPVLYAEPDVDGGDAVITFDNTDSIVVDGVVYSRFAYDVRFQKVSLHLSAVAEQGETWFGIGNDPDFSDLAISQQDGQIVAWYGDNRIASRPYRATDQVWTITFSGDQVRLAAGSDANAAPLAEMLLPSALDPASAQIAFGVTAPAGTRGEARFDGVNLESEAGVACPIQQLTESFEDPSSLDRLWPRYADASHCTYSYGAGALTLQTEGPDCAIETSTAFSLPGSAIALQLDALPTLTDGGDVYLLLFSPEGPQIYLEYHNGFEAAVCNDPPDDCFVSDESAPMGDERFWQIREDGDGLHFEVGSGGDYRPIFSSLSTFDLSTMGVRIGIVDNQPASVALAGVNAD